MSFYWNDLPKSFRKQVYELNEEVKDKIGSQYVGAYIHGSLALGGFQLNSSDLDLLIVVQDELSKQVKENLTKFFLLCSTKTFPIEVSILSVNHLTSWTYPSSFTYHFSEYWRAFYEGNKTYQDIPVQKDPDLATHLTIVKHAGIVLEGPEIESIFPLIPREDYVDALLHDIQDGLHRIEENQSYYVLNLLRVYKYLSDGSIIGKRAGAEWGVLAFPAHSNTIKEALAMYEGKSSYINTDQLQAFQSEMSRLLTPFLQAKENRKYV